MIRFYFLQTINNNKYGFVFIELLSRRRVVKEWNVEVKEQNRRVLCAWSLVVGKHLFWYSLWLTLNDCLAALSHFIPKRGKLSSELLNVWLYGWSFTSWKSILIRRCFEVTGQMKIIRSTVHKVLSNLNSLDHLITITSGKL